MVRVRKSPNIISTTGRSPAMAAPTPIPLKPASEMGVSKTRSAPNSSTSPERTLKGVPASATSSPKMQTLESRRISSAKASRTACANVSARSGIDILAHLVDAGIRRVDGELHRGLHFAACFCGDAFQLRWVCAIMLGQPFRMQLDRIALGLPVLLFRLRAVVFAVDITDVMSAVAIGVCLQEGWSLSGAGPLDQLFRGGVYCANILPVNHG